MEMEVTGDLVWPWHSWQLAFRRQCKGLQKVAIVPSGTSILLFLHSEDPKSLFCCINCCSVLMWKYQECWTSISLLCWRLFFHRARSVPRARPLLTAEAAWQLHLQALTEPQITVTPHRLETQKFSQIYFSLNVVPPVLPRVTPGALDMAGRQGSEGSTLIYGVVAPIFSWSNILCVQPLSSPMEVPAWGICCSWRSISCSTGCSWAGDL